LLPTGGSKLARFSSIHRHNPVLISGRIDWSPLRLDRSCLRL